MTVVSNTSEALKSPYADTLNRLLSDARAEAVESSVSELERLANTYLMSKNISTLCL